jgi:hypothetical protein
LLQVRVKEHTENVAGVKIPRYEYLKEVGESKMDLTGLGAGGKQISKTRDAYGTTIELLVKLASLQTAFLTLDTAIKTTNRRVNALGTSSTRVTNTIAYQVRCPCIISLCMHHPVCIQLCAVYDCTGGYQWAPATGLGECCAVHQQQHQLQRQQALSSRPGQAEVSFWWDQYLCCTS